jgi:GNAT superfamily N-acetyltransferase
MGPIRPASQHDADRIADIYLYARKSTMGYLPTVHSDEEVRTWIHEIVVPTREVYVAEHGGQIVAFAALNDDCLEHIYVDPGWHGQWIGTQLLSKVKEVRPGGFRLFVFQRNQQARSFYEARGLKLDSTTDGSNNEEKEPDCVYVWAPNPKGDAA